MTTFLKNVEKMEMRELRRELIVTRRIVIDIEALTRDSMIGKCETVAGKQNVINQIAHYCNRPMPP